MNAIPQHSAPDPATRLGFVPGLVFRAFGMRRSGNHAIADWLLRNAEGGTLFLNNCRPGQDPFSGFRSIEVNGRARPLKPALADLAGTARELPDGAVVLMTYEDTVPSRFRKGKSVSGEFDENGIDSELIIYRGFCNWLASLLKKLQANSGFGAARRAAIVLKAIDTYSEMLGLVETRDELQLTCIFYDAWIHDERYREDLLTRLGLVARDNSPGQMRREGGGSSFQPTARDFATLETGHRWQQMATDPEYLAILHLAARDAVLRDRLARLMPDDAARLSRIEGNPLFGTGLADA